MLPEISPVFALAASLAFALGGHAALAQSMGRYALTMRKAAAPTWVQKGWRVAGIAGLAAAYAACISGWGSSTGFVVFIGLASAAALSTTFALSYAPRVIAHIAYVAPALAATLVAVAPGWLRGL